MWAILTWALHHLLLRMIFVDLVADLAEDAPDDEGTGGIISEACDEESDGKGDEVA